ncbi:MAG TPA: aminotransferase class I/II-fold pyridoxal phosphate-dependent enzyme [Terriglobales bacterium]|nr:aminotransferase class I/II-fold pyridoxal phosphate-dependent enzyme [Terriglobales bacterium]
MATVLRPNTPALGPSRRIEQIGFSEIAKVREAIDALRQRGHKVFELHGGEPFFETPDAIKQAAKASLDENKTRYPPSAGIGPLRQALAKKLTEKNRIPASSANVVVTNGGIHGLFCSFQVMLDPGDEVLVFSPYWTPIHDLILLSGARPVTVATETAREQGFARTLAAHATAATKLIYFNTPQNPTGYVVSRREMEEVAAFAQERNLAVVADEAYEDLVFEGGHISIASLPGMPERTLTVFTFSKSYSMTGWRVGYVSGPEPWMAQMTKLSLYTTTGVNQAGQWAALRALQSNEQELAARREEYRRRRDLLVSGLRQAGFKIDAPAGAFYAFPQIPKPHRDSQSFADLLLQRARVSVVPGTAFGDQGEGHVRMTFSTTPEVIEAAMAALRSL